MLQWALLESILKNGGVGLKLHSFDARFSKEVLIKFQNSIASLGNDVRAKFVLISRVVSALEFGGSQVTGIRLIGLAPPFNFMRLSTS